MIAVDWTWLASINLFQVAIVILAVGLLIRFLIRFWPWLHKAMRLIDSLGQLPQFMDRTDVSLEAQDKKIAEIHHEVNYNNGSSVKDAVSRVETGVAGLYRKVDELTEADDVLRQDIENTQPRFEPPKE